ncbi:hypothetical protein CEB3_c19750 [Peptococcaceae bacterium CEB3]|nr:hypothetical protein CEB3_c19750 [Peptococcaceae bacterium CEB3]
MQYWKIDKEYCKEAAKNKFTEEQRLLIKQMAKDFEDLLKQAPEQREPLEDA